LTGDILVAARSVKRHLDRSEAVAHEGVALSANTRRNLIFYRF
jgi:hypothetical protein